MMFHCLFSWQFCFSTWNIWTSNEMKSVVLKINWNFGSTSEKPLHFSWKNHENPMKWDEIIHDLNWSYWCAKGVPHCGFQLSSSSPWGGWPCPCPDRARAAGWVSTTKKQGHIDARLAWTLGGEMPAEWRQAKARQWAVRGLSLSTRCGIHPDADPQPGLALLWMGKAAQPPSVKH